MIWLHAQNHCAMTTLEKAELYQGVPASWGEHQMDGRKTYCTMRAGPEHDMHTMPADLLACRLAMCMQPKQSPSLWQTDAHVSYVLDEMAERVHRVGMRYLMRDRPSFVTDMSCMTPLRLPSRSITPPACSSGTSTNAFSNGSIMPSAVLLVMTCMAAAIRQSKCRCSAVPLSCIQHWTLRSAQSRGEDPYSVLCWCAVTCAAGDRLGNS